MIDFFDRYADRFVPEPTSGCFLWMGAVASGGYGHFHRNGEHCYAHRCAYEAVHGVGSADGLVVRHQCDNPYCVNPDHLLAGTYRDNLMDSFHRGRANRARGERAPTAKLTEANVRSIRERHRRGETIASIKRDYPVKWDTIAKAARGINWRGVT